MAEKESGCSTNPRKRKCTNSASEHNLRDSNENNALSNECSTTAPVSSSKFAKYYRFEMRKNEPVGICLECEKEKRPEKVVKRTGGNTSGMKKHLQNMHPKVYGENNNVKISGQKTIDQMLQTNKNFTQEVWDSHIVKWMAFKKLPFNFFDDEKTQRFFNYLNPNVKMPLRTAARRKTINAYKETKANLKQLLNDHDAKVSFTIDGWTSINSKSYYAITIHLITSDWKLHSLALDFIPACGEHTGLSIAKIFFDCLKEFNLLSKIQGITVDNVASNTTFVKEFQKIMLHNGYVFDSENQRFRCFAHILNLGVQDILKMMRVKETDDESEDFENENNCGTDDLGDAEVEVDPSVNNACELSEDDDDEMSEDDTYTKDDLHPGNVITKLRNTIIKLRRSEDKQITLKNLCSASRIPYIKPILDTSTRWNSTDNMIEVAIKMKVALNLLWQTCPEVSHLKLTEDEWSLITRIHQFLKNFKIVSTILGGDKYITLPLVILAFNLLLSKIESTIFSLDDKPERTAVDEMLLLAFQAGRDKMLKHYYKTNWLYFASLILDPRHKTETFSLTDWGREMQDMSINFFEKMYKKEYYEPMLKETNNASKEEDQADNPDDLDLSSLFENSYRFKDWKDELNTYLTMKRADKNQNILDWWRIHQPQFPTLAKMARDIFSIMATSVPVERLFSLAGLVITNRRNSLADNSIRAQLCLSSWTKCSLKKNWV